MYEQSMNPEAPSPTAGEPVPDALSSLAAEPPTLARRHFLRLLSVGSAVALTGAHGAAPAVHAATPTPAPATPTAAVPTPTPAPAASPWFKDISSLTQQGDKVLESRLENVHGFLTPIQEFFVRNHSVSVDIDVASWQLTVEGDAIQKPLTLTYTDLLNLPSRTVVAYLECAGNHRSFFDLVNGQPVEGTPWRTGGVSNGEWTGVSLRDVLQLAGIKPNAVDVLLVGLDKTSPEEGLRRALPVKKALDPDTLLAYALNGETLPKDHGFPLRALVPGWVGSSSIKWLGQIVVSSKKLWTRNNTEAYVLVGDAYPPEGEAQGKVITTQVIKSALALPWPATLSAGTHRLYGYAQSPTGPIKKVEWSSDGGKRWQAATVLGPQIQYSWARFEFQWEAAKGEHTILTRATDAAGNTQPAEVPFNKQGYLFNQPVPHPITVQ